MNNSPTVFIVDDDKAILESLTWSLESRNYQVVSYTSAQKFFHDYKNRSPSCLLLDLRMKGMGGLKLQEKLIQNSIIIPIIFISAYGDIPISVQAMKKGAFDFLVKPIDYRLLLETINKAIDNDMENNKQQQNIRLNIKQLQQLTSRENQVMTLMVRGTPTKTIARELNISPNTVELHRGKVLKKMQVQSVVELTRIVIRHKLL